MYYYTKLHVFITRRKLKKYTFTLTWLHMKYMALIDPLKSSLNTTTRNYSILPIITL